MVGCCEDSNEPSGSVRGGEFLGQMTGYGLIKKECSLELVINSRISDFTNMGLPGLLDGRCRTNVRRELVFILSLTRLLVES